MKNDLAVIDTNIFVSSLIGTTGYSRKIFDDLIVTGKIKICISNDVFNEYSEVLLRDSFKNTQALLMLQLFYWIGLKNMAYGLNQN